MKGLAGEWNQLSDKEKTPYVKLQETDVKRFEKETKDLATKGFFINKEGQDNRTLKVKVKRVKADPTGFVPLK